MLITNVDDHLHNHGFLHVGHGQWQLAPAFDLNPFPDKERELKTWLTEESGPTGSVDDALAAAPFFQTEEGRAMTACCAGIATKKRMTLILVHNAG